MFCEYVNGVCPQCGKVDSSPFPGIPLRQYCGSQAKQVATPQTVCRNKGKPTGKVALIKCETCAGNVRLKFPIFECVEHGQCLPFGSPQNNEVRVCNG